MTEHTRKLFEEHSLPNFGPFNCQPHKNMNGEYHNPAIEDHWQTFQEGTEIALEECLKYIDDSFGDIDYVKFMIKRNFGVGK